MPEKDSPFRRVGGYVRHNPELEGQGNVMRLVEGNPPYKKWQEYEDTLAEIAQEPKGYKYSNVEKDTSEGVGNIRERFDIDKKPHAFWDPGSHATIKRTILEVLPAMGGNFLAMTWGPFFPEAYNAIYSPAAKSAVARHVNVTSSLRTYSKYVSPTADVMEKFINELAQTSPRDKIFAYASGVNSYTGEMVPTDLWHKLAEVCNKKGIFLLADEVVDDIRPDNESLIPFTQTNKKLAVVRSYSKVAGIPDERLSYAVVSSDLEKYYREEGMVLNLTSTQKRLANRLSKPSVIRQRIAEMKQYIEFIKKNLIEEIRYDVKVFRSDWHAPYLAIQGYDTGFHSRLIQNGVEGVSGAVYNATHEDLSEMEVRLAFPDTISGVFELGRRIIRSESV